MSNYPFRTQSIKRRKWFCPTMCGCCLEMSKTTVHLDEDELRLYLFKNNLQLQDLDPESLSTKLPEVPTQILHLCSEHQHITTPEQAYQELYKDTGWHGNRHSPKTTCDCVLAYYFDDREDIDTVTKYPAHDPVRTHRCSAHQHLSTKEDHFDVVTQENQLLAFVQNAVAEVVDRATHSIVDAEKSSPDNIVIRKEYNPSLDYVVEATHTELKEPRKLKVHFPSLKLSREEKELIKNKIEEQYPGKKHLMDIG